MKWLLILALFSLNSFADGSIFVEPKIEWGTTTSSVGLDVSGDIMRRVSGYKARFEISPMQIGFKQELEVYFSHLTLAVGHSGAYLFAYKQYYPSTHFRASLQIW